MGSPILSCLVAVGAAAAKWLHLGRHLGRSPLFLGKLGDTPMGLLVSALATGPTPLRPSPAQECPLVGEMLGPGKLATLWFHVAASRRASLVLDQCGW